MEALMSTDGTPNDSAHSTYDVIVIGGGAVGENVADRAVQGGLSALIVESELVGGECSYWACMPSKALLRSGQVLRSASKVPGAAEAITGELDVAEVLARRNTMTSNWSDDGQVAWLSSAGIDLARGHGRISGEREVTIEGDDGQSRVVTARHAVVVATGSDALIPPIPGLAEAQPWTSREATSVTDVPASLAIIGGGVIAVEMATAFASFGTAVTVIARGSLLGGLEPFAGEMVTAALRESGVTVLLNTETVRVTAPAEGAPDATTLELGDGSSVTAQKVLVATGRTPRTADIGLDTVSGEPADNPGADNPAALTPGAWIHTDDTMRVPGFDWLYAVGDVTKRALLTHQGKYQARAAGDVIAARATGAKVDDAPWGTHVASADHEAVPQVTFSDPTVASVGLTAEAAHAAGYTTRVVDYDIGRVAGAAVHEDGYRGKARMVVDESRSVILGMTFVGPDVTEMLQAATIAIVGEVPLSRLWHAVPAYPTINEVWLRLLETYGRPTG
jgi:dihydrolipoamide dehydrogenase